MSDRRRAENLTGTRISVPGHGPLEARETAELEENDAVRELADGGALRFSKPKTTPKRSERAADPKPEED